MSDRPRLAPPATAAPSAGPGLLLAGVLAAAAAALAVSGRVGLGLVVAILGVAVGVAPWQPRGAAPATARPLTRDGATVLALRAPDRRTVLFLALLTLDVAVVLAAWSLSDSPPSEHRVRAALVVLAGLGLVLATLREVVDLRAAGGGEVVLEAEYVTVRHPGGATARFRWDDVLAVVGYDRADGDPVLAFETDRAVVRGADGRESVVAARDLGRWTAVRTADLLVDPDRARALLQHYVLYPRERIVELGTPAAIVRFLG